MPTRSPTLDLWTLRLLSFNLSLSSSAPFLHLSIYHSQGWLGRKSINPSISSLTPLDRWGGGGVRWRWEEEEGEEDGLRVGDLRLLFIIFLQHCEKNGEALQVMYADLRDDRSPLWCLQQVRGWAEVAAEVSVCGRSAEAITADRMINNLVCVCVCAECTYICHNGVYAKMCLHAKCAFLQKGNRSGILLPVDAHVCVIIFRGRGCLAHSNSCLE